eukprot:5588409-Prymnesium_polylepis.1
MCNRRNLVVMQRSAVRLRLAAPRCVVAPMRKLSTHAAAPNDDYAALRLEPSQSANLMDVGTRRIFGEEHDDFRGSCRKFWQEHVVPYHAAWEEQGHVSRDVWKLAGEYGLLGINVPEEY